jgi:HPt (histidine-containing phosphotransfer) domain-containing protein
MNINPMSSTTIDLPTYESLKEAMGDDYILELLQVYFEETPKLLSELQDALVKQDSDAFRRAAHSIKSTSNSFGALEFGAQAKELEMIGREARLDGSHTKVKSLVDNFKIVQAALEELSHA